MCRPTCVASTKKACIVYHFHSCNVGLTLYCPAISCLAILMVRHFHVLHFQSTHWHELMIPWRIMRPSIARDSEQLDPRCSTQTYHRPNQRTRLSPRSPWATHFPSRNVCNMLYWNKLTHWRLIKRIIIQGTRFDFKYENEHHRLSQQVLVLFIISKKNLYAYDQFIGKIQQNTAQSAVHMNWSYSLRDYSLW